MIVAFAITTLELGGAERVFVRDVNYLHGKGHRVFCILFTDPKDFNPLISELHIPSNQIYFFGIDRLNYLVPIQLLRRSIKLGKLFVRLLKMTNFFRLNQIKILYATLDQPIVVSYLMGLLAPSLRLVIREATMVQAKSNIYRIADKLFNFRVDAWTPVSEAAKTSMSPYAFKRSKRIFVLRNGVCNPLCTFNSQEKTRYIVSTGGLKRVKNHHLLINAFSELLPYYPSIRLLIIGDGPLRSELERLVYQNGIYSQVDFLGVQSHDQLAELYSDSVIFALPSEREGCPNALLEAMSYGLPCVGSDAPAVAEIIQDGISGLIFRLGDKAGLVHALRKFLDSPALRQSYGIAAKDYINQEYSLHRHFSLLETVLMGKSDIPADPEVNGAKPLAESEV